MNEDLKMTETIREAINACTRGVDEAPSIRYRILQKARGEEEPMKKKITASMILVIALIILSVTAALAAGLGLFGKLAGREFADERLGTLQDTADVVELTATTESSVTITIDQAIYEGNHVFISYRIEGPGNMADGMSLEDGTSLDIIAGDFTEEDDATIGWKECEIPEDKLEDTLTFVARLTENKGELAFTLIRNKQFVSLAGSAALSDCQARAEVTVGRIDTIVRMYIDYPEELIDAWENGDAELFDYWYLYQDGKEVEQISDMGSMSRSAPGQILSEEFFMRLDSYENLSLSPYSSDEYAQHPETIMKLEIISPDAQPTPLPHAE